MPAKFELIAPCFFGCESTAKFELTRIGAENIRVDDGRLSFAGGAEMIAAANLNLRTVERVMLLLARYKAATFDDLFDGVYDIPWEELLPADAAFPVTGSSLNSQLSSVPACQSIIKKAVVKRLMAKHHTSVLPETGAEYKIRFMLRKDQCEIMLDTTGEGLHKRGYRGPHPRDAGRHHRRPGSCAPRQSGRGPLLRQRHFADRSRPESHEHRTRPETPLCCRALRLRARFHLGGAAPEGPG